MDIKAGYCTLCRSRCGSLSHVENGRLVAVTPDPSHPTGAALCAKGRAAPEIVGSPRRLLHPLRRTNPDRGGNPGWVEVGWNEALDEIARRLGDLRARHGAESVAFAVTTPSGTPMVDSFEWVERFVRVFGSPNLLYAVEVCGWHKDYAHALTFGRGIGAADYDAADTIVLWGHNPARTWLAQATRIAAARRRGATVVVVDPKRGGSAEDADLWLRVRPGTDAALAMGAIRHLLRQQSFDHDFVRRWTNGPFLVARDTGRFVRARDLWDGGEKKFVVLGPDRMPRPQTSGVGSDDALLMGTTVLRGRNGTPVPAATGLSLMLEAAEPYDAERVAEITGIAPADLARCYALFEGAPRLAYHAWTGVGQHRNATQTERAIAALYALTGATDRRGGNVWTVPPPARSVNDYTLLPEAQQRKALGLWDLPLGPPSRGWITARDFCRAVLQGDPYPVRALVSFGSNVVTSQGDSSRNLAALRQLGFHVHVDMFLNPTAENADIVLPANMPWEREALKVGFEISQDAVELMQLRQRVLPSPGEARADYDVVFDLACRLGHAEAFFGGSVEAGWNHQLEPTGLTVAELRAQPNGVRLPQPRAERKYALPGLDGKPVGFATPTQRVELYSELLHEHGYPPLPGYIPPEPAGDAYPLRLSTAKSGWFVHSSHRHVASLRRKSPDPLVEISPAAASARGIEDGAWTMVVTPRGRARLRARLDPTLADDVVIAEFGWWEDCPPLGRARSPLTGPVTCNVNDALSDDDRDPVSGSVPLRAVACQIVRDQEASRGWWSGERAFIVASLRREASDVLAVTLRPLDGGPLASYLPGQHVVIRAAESPARAYSLTRWSARPESYEIAVKRIGPDGAGRVSTLIHGLVPGDRLTLEAPRGTFTPPLGGNRPVLLFAAGIGITPFVGYLDALAATPACERPPGVHLVHMSRDGRGRSFGPHLRGLVRTMPGVLCTDVFTQPTGDDVSGRDYDRTGRSALLAPDLPFPGQRPLAYLCGPSGFVEDVRALLRAAGVPDFDVSTEVFVSTVEVPPDLAPRSVRLRRSDVAFPWFPASGTLLDAADAAGIRLPSGCRAGQCENCCLRVVSGEVAHLSAYDGPPTHCLTCRAVPLSDLVIEA